MSLPTKESLYTSRTSCRYCGREFLEYTHRLESGHGKFCSRACTTKHTFTGRSSWNKGKTGLPSTPASFKKGQVAPMKGRPNLKIRGENHHNWKGGITLENNSLRVKFRRTIQPLVFQRDNYSCQICLQEGGYLQVDHIKSWKDYPELRFIESNCRTLCMACHYYVTFKRKLPQGVIWGHNLSRRIG